MPWVTDDGPIKTVMTFKVPYHFKSQTIDIHSSDFFEIIRWPCNSDDCFFCGTYCGCFHQRPFGCKYHGQSAYMGIFKYPYHWGAVDWIGLFSSDREGNSSTFINPYTSRFFLYSAAVYPSKLLWEFWCMDFFSHCRIGRNHSNSVFSSTRGEKIYRDNLGSMPLLFVF